MLGLIERLFGTAKPVDTRPTTFGDLIGQDSAKGQLREIVQCSKKNRETPSHMLFLGPAGVGKSSMAGVVANEMGVTMRSIMGTRINNWNDIRVILEQIQERDLLFIDEIHALKPKIQEELYGVLEDFQYDTPTGKKKLPKFTVIGATTHAGLLSAPFRRRFPVLIYLEPYTIDQLMLLIGNRAEKMYRVSNFPTDVARRMATLSKGNAAEAVNMLTNLRTTAEANWQGKVTAANFTLTLLERMLKMKSIDPIIGLDRISRRYIALLVAEDRPIGAKAVSTMLNEQPETVVGMIEPFLVSDRIDVSDGNGGRLRGPLVKTTRMGRQATLAAVKYLEMCVKMQSNGWFPNEVF